MSAADVEYYRARAVAERELAKAAPSENIARIHEELARHYEAFANQPEARPKLGLAF